MTTVEVSGDPGNTFLRAAAGLLPGRRRSGTLPDRHLVRRRVPVDRSHLAAYDRVCGFRLTDALPATYPHVLAFPLAMRLMSAADFPFPVVGLVHIANTITQLRPIDAAEQLDVSVHATGLRDHHRGRRFDLVATATIDGEEVWRGVSAYLKREATPEDQPTQRNPDGEEPTVTARWAVPGSQGREYAAVSGDHNPIHTSWVGARLFGFPRPIAHGMWSKARCLAALADRLPARYTVDVAFRAPILLPATVGFGAAERADGWDFRLHSKRSHLAGEVTHP